MIRELSPSSRIESGARSRPPIRVRIDRGLIESDGLHEVLARLAGASAGEILEVEADFEPPVKIEVPDALADEVSEACARIRYVRRGRVGLGERLILVRDEAAKAAVGPGSFVASRYEAPEGGDMTSLVHFARRSELEPVRGASQRRLWQWREEWRRFTRAYLVATGPSFDRYKEIEDFEGAFVVACNSAVIDREFMERARPSLLVFGDPIFHFGPSRYASEFRERVRAAAAEFDFRIAVTEKYCFLFSHFFPELVERTVFVPSDGTRSDFHWRLEEEFVVKSTKNILTLLMIPFGAAFARRLDIIGCDGRRLADDGYFWGHSAAAQINNRMRNIQEAHPGFFQIDYNDYYLTHCRQLERFFLDLERSGIEVVSASPSCIPALARRSRSAELAGAVDTDTVNALMGDGARRVRARLHQLDGAALRALRFVSVNPSLKDSMGHPLYQDLSIRRAVSPDGNGFVSLGDARFEETIHEGFVLPVFETRIWQIHRSAGAQRRVAADAFVEELLAALEMLDASSRLDDAVVFLYMGHPALLPALVRRWGTKRFRCRRFVFNLFSGFFEAPTARGGDGPLHAVAQLADDLAGFEDLVLVCDSSPLASDFDRIAGMRISLLPMCPSQSLVSVAGEGGAADFGGGGRKLRVVYPSQSEEFRGFEVLTRFLFLYAEEFADTFEFIIRIHPPGRSKAFVRKNVTWVRGVLDEKGYAELLDGADIVLLPYSPEEFHYRTSSILAEAFSLGKPVVAMAESWLGLQVSKTGCGWLADSWDSAGLREIFHRIANEGEKVIALQGAARMREWCEENRVERFVDAIFRAVPAVFTGGRSTDLCERILFADSAKGSRDEFRALFQNRVKRDCKRVIENIPVGLRYKLEPTRAMARRFMRNCRRFAAGVLSRLRGKGRSAGETRIRFDSGGITRGLPPHARVELDDAELCRRLALISGKGATGTSAVLRVETREALDPVLSGPGGFVPPSIHLPREVFVAPGAVHDCASRLEGAGFQVWVCQWHPESADFDGSPWFRIFPFPSYPLEDTVPASLMGFRRPLRLPEVQKEVVRLLGGR